MSTHKPTSPRQSTWLVLAVASGACAAINGVFAKLTTTALTTSWSHGLATLLSLSPDNAVINFLLRALFFALNLGFNVLMWTLFTAALTRASSTTRVSIVNVSANFMVTALLGALVFAEKLNRRWWLGAAFLAVGNVVIGRREEGDEAGGREKTTTTTTPPPSDGEQVGLLESEENAAAAVGDEDGEVADIIDLGDENVVGIPKESKE